MCNTLIGADRHRAVTTAEFGSHGHTGFPAGGAVRQAVEPSGGGMLLEEMSHCKLDLRFTIPLASSFLFCPNLNHLSWLPCLLYHNDWVPSNNEPNISFPAHRKSLINQFFTRLSRVSQLGNKQSLMNIWIDSLPTHQETCIHNEINWLSS